MRKTLSAILIAALLAFTAICTLAVQAEEPAYEVGGEPEQTTGTSAVVYNFLAALTDTDGSYYTIENQRNGAVTVTLKQEATQESPIILATYSDAKLDLSGPIFVAADFVTENPDMDFRLHYTRKDYEDTDKNGIADLYFTGMKKAADYTKTSTDSSIVWDFSAYVSGAKRYEDNIHDVKDLAITAGSAGDVITFNTLAMVSDANAMSVGSPLVGGAGDGDVTSKETSSDETSSEATSSEETSSVGTSSDETSSVETSSDDPSSTEPTSEGTSSANSASSAAESTSSGPVAAGDAGVILFVVLAVLAAAGAITMVRLRQE